MPKSAVRSRRSVATVTSTAVIGASLAVLLLPVTAPSASAAAAPGSTQRASVRSPGNDVPEGYRGAQDSVLSGNGESVVFTSQSRLDPSLDVGDGESIPYRNVFVRDLVRQKTIMLSRGQFDRPTGGSGTVGVNFGPKKLLELQPGGGGGTSDGIPIRDTAPTSDSYTPSVSADGRFVAFITEMNNMFQGDTSFRDKVVVVDRDPDGDGNYDEERDKFGTLSKDYKYYQIDRRAGDFGGNPTLPKIAGNASRIVWQTATEGGDRLLNSTLDIRNSATGTLGQIQEVPTQAILNHFLDHQNEPAISGDGNHIVMHTIYFESCDCNDPPGFHAILSADMRQLNNVIRVDVAGGKPISESLLQHVQHPAVNGDGSVIAFAGEQHALVDQGPQLPPLDVASHEPTTYVVQIANNKVTRTDIVSRDNKFTIINGDRPGLSADGRYITFVTNNLNAHDGTDGPETNGDCIKPAVITVRNSGDPLLRLNGLPPPRDARHTTCQVVMRDLIVDQDRLGKELPRLPGTLVSPNTKGNAGDRNTVPLITENQDRPTSTAPSLSDNGGRIAYDSAATDLVTQPRDDDRTHDVFVRTMEPTLSGKTVEFGQVEINTSSTKTAVLTEVGSGPLVVAALSIIGPNAADFTVGAQTCTTQTIHATGSCEVSVKFAPTAIGDRRAQLLAQIRGGRRTVVDLTGSGTEQPPVPPRGPNFSAAPDTLAFGTRLLLSSGPESAVTITNSGDLPLQIPTIDFVGATAPDYKITKNTCGTSVPAGGQCAVTVSFSPKGSGNRNAVLRFNDNAPGGPHLIALTGAANQPTIVVNPGVTPPGRVVAVTGKDFPPNMVVTVKFDGRIGETTIRPANDGTFRAQLLVFPKASPETRTVLATMPEFTDPLAKGPLLIVYPTVSPANFVVRG